VAIGPDGCGDFGPLGRLRIEGQPPAESARTVAAAAGLPASAVHVRVAEYNSQHIYLFGEIIGLDRAVPYQGPETVVELLQRIGGITPDAAPGDVHVIRSHVTQGRAPEVFHIDLQAIVFRKDHSTNVRLQPFDQVYVGQTRQAVLERCLPPWLRTMFTPGDRDRAQTP
jgi:protein involved in polysaccharide export with SLBB domain